ncbi:hypothetical protein QBC34DRAFT_273797, partial [Podospora aff. communis PSN243]
DDSEGYTETHSQSRTMEASLRRNFAKDSARERSYGNSHGVSYKVSISDSTTIEKPEYAKEYCGSWFAVPTMGMECGRATIGKLNRTAEGEFCTLKEEYASFEQCFDYTWKDEKRPEASRYDQTFVLKDCAEGFILPGEWQHPAFANSFGVKAFATNHVRRFGLSNTHTGRGRLSEEGWAYNGTPKFTRTIGPEDFTVELCGRGKYCARHKVDDNTCYTLPRGYSGVKSAHVVSARTSPGNCCVLFSRPECHGLAQLLKGAVDDFSSVGYEGMAHSFICNVGAYCNPQS